MNENRSMPSAADNSGKKYDLERRTREFAQAVRSFVRKLPKDFLLIDDIRQVIRSSGSIGANYIEANESLSKRDFLLRIKISRKEAKETIYWLEILQFDSNQTLTEEKKKLAIGAGELEKIMGAIYRKSQ